MKIRTRIFICFFLIVAAGFYYLVDWIADDLKPRYLEAMEESLVDTATILAVMVGQSTPDASALKPDHLHAVFEEASQRPLQIHIYSLTKRQVDLRVYIVDTNGIVQFDSAGGGDEGKDYSLWNDVYLTLKGRYGARATRSHPDDPASSILYVAAPILVKGQLAGSLTVCKPTVSSNLFLASAQRKLAVAGTLAGLAVILLGLATSAWVTLPIRRLTAYAEAIRDGRPAKLPPLGRSEIGIMGRAMEDMRVALEGKEYVERYVQTLTHELKGPLSAIQGALELVQEESMPPPKRTQFLENARRESLRIRQMVDRLLLLSSLESRRALRDLTELDLAQVLQDAEEALAPLLASKSLRLSRQVHAPTLVRGERFLLFQAVYNLLQNAIGFAPGGSEIAITLTVADSSIELCIRDKGPGIPDYALARVFERFYSLPRPDTGRKSSGLGLAIVREIAGLHQGSVCLENAPSGGACATLLLPPV
ncbi:MAG TPA: two-component system sensor histidine kinase CreC [Verrucomicrobia bacterium]|nr:MAG: two-component system sensor histidine kinase CreC [Lentisphaerae bacterium GWF2_57_35]HBA85790.1 two-component system sensor histidine kinase CreC [Verrucomicrobiota bacterium]